MRRDEALRNPWRLVTRFDPANTILTSCNTSSLRSPQVTPPKPSKVLAKQEKMSRERRARKSEIDAKKAEDELTKAHETAVNIARQRSRR